MRLEKELPTQIPHINRQGGLLGMGFTVLDTSSGDPERTAESRFRNWTPADARDIYLLEKETWPPGLRRPKDQILHIAQNYPDTQFLTRNLSGLLVATLTATRINWDGARPLTDITWDTVVGGSVNDGSYPDYNKTGKALIATSTSVHPDYKGHGWGSQILTHAIKEADRLGIEYFFAPMRPSGYGEERITTGEPDTRENFTRYSEKRRPDGKLADNWLRTAENIGLEPIGVVYPSMTVRVSTATLFGSYKHDPYYNPIKYQGAPYFGKPWQRSEDGKTVDTVGLTGHWEINGSLAVYTEGNYWMGGRVADLMRRLPTAASPQSVPQPR